MALRKNSTFPQKVISIHYGVIYRERFIFDERECSWTLGIYFLEEVKESGECPVFITFNRILNDGVKLRKIPNTFYIQLTQFIYLLTTTDYFPTFEF